MARVTVETHSVGDLEVDILVTQSDEGYFIAWVEGAYPCEADGDTHSEAVAAVLDILHANTED